jgi:RNA methyltransferase, TrmH family
MTISNNDLKKFSSLNRKIKRKEHQLFVVEGEKICKELLKNDFEFESIITTKDFQDKFPLSTVCSKKEIARISHLKNPSNVVAICKIPTYKINKKDKKPLIFLDNVNDPGNFGTIVRTLDWFGYKQLFCSKNTVDCFNSKSLMASMGSIFRVNCHYIDFVEFQQLFPQHVTFGSSLTGDNIGSVKLETNSIIVIGNESNGVSKNIKEKLKNTIRIPGNGKAESLNVSVATGIILNELEKLTLKSK